MATQDGNRKISETKKQKMLAKLHWSNPIPPDSIQAQVHPDIAGTCCLLGHYDYRNYWEHINRPAKLVRPEGKRCILHKCDCINGYCVNPEHIFFGSIKDNSQDMFKKGRSNWQKIPDDQRSKNGKKSWEGLTLEQYKARCKKISERTKEGMANMSPETRANVERTQWRKKDKDEQDTSSI